MSKKIGQGLTADVYLKTEADGSLSAQKVFKRQYMSSFNNQKISLRDLKDDDCFPLIKSCSKNTITMEYLQGFIPLSDFLTNSFPWIISSDIKNKIKECLVKLHSKQICHNDLHSDNIMINPKNGKIKILDFGFSGSFNNKCDDNTNVESIFHWYSIYQVEAVLLFICMIIGCFMIAKPASISMIVPIIISLFVISKYFVILVVMIGHWKFNVRIPFVPNFVFKYNNNSFILFIYAIACIVFVKDSWNDDKKTWSVVFNFSYMTILLIYIIYKMKKDNNRSIQISDWICGSTFLILYLIPRTIKWRRVMLVFIGILTWLTFPSLLEFNLMNYLSVLGELLPIVYAYILIRKNKLGMNRAIIGACMILPFFLFCGGISMSARKTDPYDG